MKFDRNSRLSACFDQILSRPRSATIRTETSPSIKPNHRPPSNHRPREKSPLFCPISPGSPIRMYTTSERSKSVESGASKRQNFEFEISFLPRKKEKGIHGDRTRCEKRRISRRVATTLVVSGALSSFGNRASRRSKATGTRETGESHSETRVSRAGGVIPRSRGPSQDTSAKPRRERGSSGFVRFRRCSALPDTPGRRSSRPTRDERPRQFARPTDASATPNRKVPFSLRSRCSSLGAARASCNNRSRPFLHTGSTRFSTYSRIRRRSVASAPIGFNEDRHRSDSILLGNTFAWWTVRERERRSVSLATRSVRIASA